MPKPPKMRPSPTPRRASQDHIDRSCINSETGTFAAVSGTMKATCPYCGATETHELVETLIVEYDCANCGQHLVWQVYLTSDPKQAL